MTRTQAYRWLACALSIRVEECHIGMFDERRCMDALTALSARGTARRVMGLTG
jgi:hypothetical protein